MTKPQDPTPAPKPPDKMTALRRIAQMLERQPAAARKWIIATLTGYFEDAAPPAAPDARD